LRSRLGAQGGEHLIAADRVRLSAFENCLIEDEISQRFGDDLMQQLAMLL
jgi:hypothetical protein